MDKVIKNLDQRMQSYVEEARNTDISINPDSYLAKVLAQQGLKDTHENRKNFLQARDELYHTRLLLHYKDVDGEGLDEISGNSAIRDFFKNSGFEVIDNRRNGGRLWIIGEKKDIRDTVNLAITQFGISGKYASSKETNFKNGWYTKTDK